MTLVTLDAARKELPQLIARARSGEEIIIADDSGPVARLAPLLPAKFYRGRGAFKGQFVVGPEFFEPLPDDELKWWEGRGDE